jgi:hypothetical protein
MHAAQTIILTVPPFCITLTLCRLGKKRRLVIPVVCRPMPPCFFAMPRRTTLLPILMFFPQISQSFPISNSLTNPDDRYNLAFAQENICTQDSSYPVVQLQISASIYPNPDLSCKSFAVKSCRKPKCRSQRKILCGTDLTERGIE